MPGPLPPATETSNVQRKWLRSLTILAWAACGLAHADILVGQTADFSGPVAAGV